ncbi:MAG: hypothetical protein HOG03_18800 [Desulfobacula sp.]|jgi:hypothetical protein|uniref:hypothetical protein n=1 Tax=Desulfobacula sp. TaxID=2593537 RepID=UPI001DC64E5B|nr:hypothetical protein [Desulfobacula sp.]MBT3487405.1 hypothetical protein [Desulfobacula sp.]MBT3806623.1 hypothetical protein [Desulfobacula sp.]MBT4025851.1 hypothetical protein [Desulfobacula sp.]MBT4200625.1 hypothetical protein [Desulfobacula sp.]
MQKKIVFIISMILIFLFTGIALANDLQHLFQQVEQLKIQRQGYVLGAILNPEQIKTAASNRVDESSNWTYKFRDKNLFVVADKTSNRVLIIYEQFKDLKQKNIQDLIGDLYMSFDEPTVLAHDKRVYWAYTKKGKITSKEFDAVKQDKKNLDILAKIKFISDINIMEKTKGDTTGQVSYIISSDPILNFFKNQKL